MDTDLSNFGKRWLDAHFLSFLFYDYCTKFDYLLLVPRTKNYIMWGPPVGFLKGLGSKYKIFCFWFYRKKSTLSCNRIEEFLFFTNHVAEKNRLLDTKFSSNINYILIFHFPFNEIVSQFIFWLCIFRTPNQNLPQIL